MSVRSFSRPRAYVVAFLLVLSGGLGACSSAPRGALAIELAPATRCSSAEDAFEANWECLRIQVCESPAGAGPAIDAGERDAGTRDAGTSTGSGCVEITTPGGDHEGASDELIVRRNDLVAFDARVESGRQYDVSVTAYGAGGEPVATGRTRYVTPLGEPIRVRLYRYGMSSCAGVLGREVAAGESVLPAHRAMGAAISMPNGDVLFFGGATGDDVDAAQLTSVARFQRSVQVYDASLSRFFDVTVNNTAEPTAPAGFGRVLFEARDLGTEADGRQRVRVFGGFTAIGPDATALRFDQNLFFTAFGIPVLPTVDTEAAAPAVDILYDPLTRTADIELVPTMAAVPSTGGAGVSEIVGGRAISAGGISTNGGPTNLMRPDEVSPTLSSTFQRWDDGLTSSHPLGPAGQDFGRHGATVTYLSGTSYLVWGGNIRVLAPALYRDFSGVLLDVPTAGVTATPIAAPDLGPLPAPVAFHSATRLSPEHVLITGGLPITASSTAGRPTVELAPAPPGFSILVRDAGAFRSTSVSGDPRAPTILHQATVLTQAGGVSSAVLVTGGALIRTFPAASTTSTTFWASNEVGVLTGSADVWSYRVATTLRGARFGHTTTVIEGVGVLVVGGYREEVVGEVGAQTVMLQPVLDPEFFLIEDLLGLLRPDPQDCEDAGVATDAGRRDAGAPDAGADAGLPDAPVDLDAPDMPDAPI